MRESKKNEISKITVLLVDAKRKQEQIIRLSKEIVEMGIEVQELLLKMELTDSRPYSPDTKDMNQQ